MSPDREPGKHASPFAAAVGPEPLVIGLLLDDDPLALDRVVGLLRRRRLPPQSMTVHNAGTPHCLRLGIDLGVVEVPVRRVCAELRKLVAVREVRVLGGGSHLARGLVLVKVRADAHTRTQVRELGAFFRAQVIDVGRDALIVEAAGERGQLARLVDLLEPYGILEVAHSGPLSLTRSNPGADPVLPASLAPMTATA